MEDQYFFSNNSNIIEFKRTNHFFFPPLFFPFGATFDKGFFLATDFPTLLPLSFS